jgi:hypothetical protein
MRLRRAIGRNVTSPHGGRMNRNEGAGAMTRITTGCPQCGRVDLAVEEITLVLSPREEHAWYVFDCFGCAERVVKPAPTTVSVALTSVRVQVWTVPAEALERIGPLEATPIDADDLLDLLLTLRADPDLVALAAGTSAPAEVEPRPGAAFEQEQRGRHVRDRTAGEATNPSPDAEGSRPARPNAA